MPLSMWSEFTSLSTVSQTTVPVLLKCFQCFFVHIRRPLCNICLLTYKSLCLKHFCNYSSLAWNEFIPLLSVFLVPSIGMWHTTVHNQTAASHLNMNKLYFYFWKCWLLLIKPPVTATLQKRICFFFPASDATFTQNFLAAAWFPISSASHKIFSFSQSQWLHLLCFIHFHHLHFSASFILASYRGGASRERGRLVWHTQLSLSKTMFNVYT